MVELTARFQFVKLQHKDSAMLHFIFDPAHIPFLKPIAEQKLPFYVHGTLEEGLRFNSERDPTKRAPLRLTLYNKKMYKIQTKLDSRRFKTKPPAASKLEEIKVTWDAHKKEFQVPPINPAALTSRVPRFKKPSRKSAAEPAAPPPAPAPEPVAPSPLERLRDSIRETNKIATELGIQLALEQGRVRAILTFE